MPVSTIDRKLHRIILDSNTDKYPSAASLAHFIADKGYDQFSYYRDGKKKFCKWNSISTYVYFAQEVGLLDSNCFPTAPKEDLRSLASFKHWSGDLLLRFSREKGFGINKLETAVINLISEKKQLPTTEQLYTELSQIEVSKHIFRWALNLQSLLRPATLGLCRRWLWIPNGIYKYN